MKKYRNYFKFEQQGGRIMAITGINNSSCTSYYASNYKNTVKKTDSEKDSTNTKDGNVTTSTVELKKIGRASCRERV